MMQSASVWSGRNLRSDRRQCKDPAQCTLHHTGVAQTSGSSEHPGPCLGHQRPLPPSGPTSTPRHGGSSHVSPQGPHSSPSASCMAQTHDTTALPIASGGHASHTINNTRKRLSTRRSSTPNLQFVYFIFPQQCRLLTVVRCVCATTMPTSAVGTATAKPYKCATPVLRRGW